MTASSISLKNFRNYEKEEILLSPKVNILWGQNAQGKTNLLEAVYYFGAAKSFRGGKDKTLKKFDQEHFEIGLNFFSRDREQELLIKGGGEGKREIWHNGVKKKSAAETVGLFVCVLFAPEHLTLIKNGPAERRKFLDFALSQLKPAYFSALLQYQKVLEQKGAILKNLEPARFDSEVLEVYNQNLARFGAVILKGRFEYLALLNQEAKRRHLDISSGKEELFMAYDPGEGIAEGSLIKLEEQLKATLTQNGKRETAARMCLVGPHRDNLEVFINGKNARLFASQGQQRSAVLSLKLAECSLVCHTAGEQPVLLLDDILSELDESRQNYILHHMEERQVLLTCCEQKPFAKVPGKRTFFIESGHVQELE